MWFFLSGILISGIGTILIVYAKNAARIPPAAAGLAMWVYPFFVYDVWWLWGITAALLVALFFLREKN